MGIYNLMKGFIFIVCILLGVKEYGFGQNIKQVFDTNQKQEVFVLGTNNSQDGYITGGFMLGEWGLYAGIPYSERNNILNKSNGTITRETRFGLLKYLTPEKVIFGIGAQPTIDGTKLNSFVGYNPLKSKDMKLWMIGNVTGSVFSFGAGLSYIIKSK